MRSVPGVGTCDFDRQKPGIPGINSEAKCGSIRPLYILIAVCIETNGLTRLRAPIPENVGLPREIFINDKPERFVFIALVYWDAVNMNIHFVVI